MNGIESSWALALAADPTVASWYYEGIKLRLADGVFYTPDFFVVRVDGGLECHECKAGRVMSQKRDQTFTEASRVRVRVAAERFPAFRFVVVRKGRTSGFAIEEVGA